MRRFPRALLLTLCILSGSQWLLPSNDLSPRTELLCLATGVSLAGVVLCLLWRGAIPATREAFPWKLVLSGVGAIGAPALLLLMGRQQYSAIMAVATQASLPVVVAMTSSVIDPGSELQDHLVPALVALGGAFLVLPIGLPLSSHGWYGLFLYVAAVCLSGVFSVFCHREMNRLSRGAALTVVVLANAIFLSIAALVWMTLIAQEKSFGTLMTRQSAVLILIAAMNILLLGALLQLLAPMATASRVILAPLIGTLEAYALLRPTVSLRTAFGALLMLVGGLACLRVDSKQATPKHMSLR